MSTRTEKNYYELLGISNDADPKAIKAAYWRAAGRHHPDKGGDERAFKRICKAYDVLSDPEKRKYYDEKGTIEGYKNNKELARERICTLVGSIVNHGSFMADHTDLIRRVREEINEISLQYNNKISDQEILLRRYNAVIERIDNADFIHAFMVESKDRVEANIAELHNDLVIQDLMHELIVDAVYNFNLDKEMPNGQTTEICEEEEGQEIRPVQASKEEEQRDGGDL